MNIRKKQIMSLLLLAVLCLVCGVGVPDQAVADPDGTPSQRWAWWLDSYATEERGQADLAAYRSLTDIPQCESEDGSTTEGYERICEWRAGSVGNRMGESYVLVDGRKVLSWGGMAEK